MPQLRSELPSAAESAAAGGAGKETYVRQIFSDIAPRYDLVNHVLSLNIDRRWRSLALRQLGWEKNPSGVYLDLCAGTLDVAAGLARERGFSGSVFAADFAEPMLRLGRAKVGNRPVFPVTGDALSLPLRDNCVDGAIVAFGVRNLANLGDGLREVHRVLRKNSRFVILEFSTPRSALVRLAYLTYFNHVASFIGGLISGHRSAYRYLPKSVAHFPSESTLAEMLRQTGFANVSWRSLTFGIAAIHVGEKT